jgi:uncharacterized oligopeptide transporter (OPT) family protein
MNQTVESSVPAARRRRFLPAIGTPAYYILLGAVAILLLGPLGGVTAAYMNFSLGFFVGGQVLAGILGSVVTYGYGAEGKHGANYMQTMAASVAGMSGMSVLIQAMAWLGLPEPPTWQLILFFTCIGMFGVGIGMLYTPILVDKMQLAFPSGLAVANILRALTDKLLLRRSVAVLGSGTAFGLGCGLLAEKVVGAVTRLGAPAWSIAWMGAMSTIGAGMIVTSRIAVPAIVVGAIGELLKPYLVEIGWLAAGEPFRKIGFLIALGAILGAAIVDLSIIGYQAVQRLRERAGAPAEQAPDWKRVNTLRLLLWIGFWGVLTALVASQVLQQPLFFVALAIGLVFLFLIINGISQGISDSNPISSAFVIAVFVMASFGLRDPAVGLMCAAILLIACSVGVDMQQDRSTGWRLGTNRVIQFRYQVIGIVMGAVMAVVLAKVFMAAYPVLKVDTFTHSNTPGAEHWQSAMTFKFVGALKGLTDPKPEILQALFLGVAIGFVTEVLRKLLKGWARYQAFRKSGKAGFAADWAVDSIVLPSPYASSFGGFVDVMTSLWFAVGGVIASVFNIVQHWLWKRHPDRKHDDVPEDMSTMSLVGGGLIAGDSLAALGIGIYGLLSTVI